MVHDKGFVVVAQKKDPDKRVLKMIGEVVMFQMNIIE